MIYRIIGKPERWHDDYLDVMHQILDETDSFENPDSFSELAVGDQIISQIKQYSEALTVFNALLDQNRFKMVILDDQLTPIYRNKNAESLANYLLEPADKKKIRVKLAKLIQESIANNSKRKGTLQTLDFLDDNGDQIYLRTIQNRRANYSDPTEIHTLYVLDQSRAHNELNTDLLTRYELTNKEHMVLRGLIHGKSIKEIAEKLFISENTVKSHLKAIFAKTGTNSQTAVVRLILTHEAQILDSYFESEIELANDSMAHSNEREVILSEGHKIAYCEYGPADGRPLLVFHSGFGCRLSIPKDYQDACKRTHRRIIIADRPGRGKTPYIKGHPKGWNDRVGEFIDILGLGQYDLLGSVLGCQMAINFAANAADERLEKIILCSPVVINERSHTQFLTGILSPSARLVRASPRFAREIYELWLKSVTLNLDNHYLSMLESSCGSKEKELFKSNGTFELMVDVFRESARHSLKGISREMVRCITPMNLDLKRITVPVDIWYGSEDKRLSLEGVNAIAGDIPNHRLHVREGYSEHIYYSLFEEIIRAC